MIFYFSGTGNSRWAARQLAERTGDEALDIIGLKDVPDLTGQERVGLVFPIYAWGAAQPMRDFAARLPKTEAFTYGVCTCGANAGAAMKKLSALWRLDSCYSVVMPSNYILGEDVEPEDVIRRKLADARTELERIAEETARRQRVYRVTEGPAPGLRSGLICGAFNRFARSTRPFHVTAECVGCGQCARECPAGTIRMEDGRPVWGEKCWQCMRCIHGCPQRAIQYGEKTESRSRYVLEKYL